MRILGAILLLLGVAVVVGETAIRPPLRCYAEYVLDREARGPNRYCEWPPARLDELLAGLEFEQPSLRARIAELEAQFQADMMALTETERVRRADGMVNEPQALRDARLSLAHSLAEAALIRRAQRIQTLPLLAVGAGAAGLGLVLLVVGVLRGRRGAKGRIPAAYARVVGERREERAMEPAKAEAVAGTLYVRRREAIAAMWELRPKRCDYCNAVLPHEPAGTAVYVTLVKTTPTDVKKPKRVVLAEGWRFDPPEKIVCAACGHGHRGS